MAHAHTPIEAGRGIRLRGGLLLDGTGRPGLQGDLLIHGGRISAVGAAPAAPGAWEIDCSGLAVAPGFIDMHSHNDWFLPAARHERFTEPFLRQGITTFVGGNCGFSAAGFAPGSPHLALVRDNLFRAAGLDLAWFSVDDYFRTLEAQGLSHNLVLLAGHGTTRASLRGFAPGALPPPEGDRLLGLLEESLEQGAAGISLGLQYEPGIFAPPAELEAVARLASRRGKPLTVHARALSALSGAYPLRPCGRPHNLQAIAEALDLARRTGVRLQFSHLIFVGRRTWKTVEAALEMFHRARGEGLDVGFDTFHHAWGASLIHVVLPPWFLARLPGAYTRRAARLRLRGELAAMERLLGFGFDDIVVAEAGHPDHARYNGLSLAEIAARRGRSPCDTLLTLAAASGGQTRVLMRRYNTPEIVRELVRRPEALLMTDAWVEPAGTQNPGAYGAFAGFLQAAREHGHVRLEEVVHKMTGAGAARFGLRDRGRLQAGMAADVTVFDPATVADRTAPGAMDRAPDGIVHVFVNGQAALLDGHPVPGVRAGQVLR